MRLVERDNESNVIARATIVVVRHTYPSHIRNLKLTSEGNGSLTVTWNAPRRTGGSAIVGYGVQHRRDGESWASEVPAVRDTSGTGTSHTVTGLTNGQKYHIRVTPCNQQSGCLPWSERFGFSHASVSGRPKAPTPTPTPTPPPPQPPAAPRDLRLTPEIAPASTVVSMNARMARLTWIGDNTATDYIVEAKALGSNTWKRLAKFHTGMGHGKDTTRAIFLDTFFTIRRDPTIDRLEGSRIIPPICSA